jgi:hypothetical protein
MPRHPAVEKLRTAADRTAARSAAYDVARAAVEDAVAVTPGADLIVADLRRLIEQGTPWQPDALAALIYVLDHAHVYRDLRAAARTYRGQWDWGVAEEEAVERTLEGLDSAVRNMLDAPGPETRSLASLTLSRISPDPPADRALIRLLADAEPDDRTRAALMEAALRLGDPDPPTHLTAETRHRIAWYLAATRQDEPPTVLHPLHTISAEPEPPWRWPSEQF